MPALKPASVQVLLSDNLVAPDGTTIVIPVVRDKGGTVINDPTFEYRIRIVATGPVAGNPPVIEGRSIRFPKVVKQLLNPNPQVDPTGEFADADPADPNYGKETGGIYKVTATLIGRGAQLAGRSLSGNADVIVLPTGTAKITVRTKQYGDQLAAALGALDKALVTGDPQQIEMAKQQLQAVAADPANSFEALGVNNVTAPPNGLPVSPAQLIQAGFQPGDDDALFATTLNALQSQTILARNRVEQINPLNVTQADVDALQAIADGCHTISKQLAALDLSTLGTAYQSEKLNTIISSDMTKLFDTVTRKVIAIVVNMPTSMKTGETGNIVTIFGPLVIEIVGIIIGLGDDAKKVAEVITNHHVHIQNANIVNSQMPGCLGLEWVQASSSVSFVCPYYANTFVAGSGFSINPAKTKVLLLGCVNNVGVSSLMTLRPCGGRDMAAGIRLSYAIIFTARGLWGLQGGRTSVETADRVVTDYLWDYQVIFDNGWRRVTQEIYPCTGTIIVFNLETGSFAATNRNFLHGCG
ncbi:MAG: hypothetical protein H7Y30_16585 [Pyrinomonadaceae bacterium]|nr:hypothetical protein [Pyrinomonadaceae bacterium]